MINKLINNKGVLNMLIMHSHKGKSIWFWYKTAPAADANYLRIRKQSKNSAYSQQSGPISQIVWTDSILIFNSVMVLNLKVNIPLPWCRPNGCMKQFKILLEQPVCLKLALISFWQKSGQN